ncbi:sugar transferase [Curtobacterium sp. MCPF17_047]|nr:sugar transferase [Curtobacterium sp. MCPF17_001]PZF67114.1 sugar transferase [Curtobacterium sp. MCPF17_047]
MVIATVILIVTAFPLAVATLVVATCLGRPVLFRQERIGLHGAPFTIVKLRTMRPFDPARGLSTDASRLTRFGVFLRATSIDELPSLVNVLRGEMSIVGPRPLPVTYGPRFTGSEKRRHEVRPGLTGLAQVHGRNALSWEDRFRLDVEYVDRCSVLLDFRILLRTAGVVLRARGITAAGCATMHELRPEHGPVPGPAVRT